MSINAEQEPLVKYNFLSDLSKNTLTVENIVGQGVYDLLPQTNNWVKQQYEEIEATAI